MKNFDEFEKSLLHMKSELEASILQLKDELNIIAAEENINDMEDMASLVSDNLHHKSLLKQQENELAEVNHALGKIKNASYGICEKSGKQISIERLRVLPHTRYAVDHTRS